MKIESYGNTQSRKQRILKRRITGIVTILAIIIAGAFIIGIITDDNAEYMQYENAISENHQLKAQIEELTEENENLKIEIEQLKVPQEGENEDAISPRQ